MASTGPSSTTRPRYITTTSSHISATTPRLCVMRTTAMASRAWRLRSRSRIWAWVVTSRAVVGSSAMRIRGPQESAVAVIARWRGPADLLARLPAEPDGAPHEPPGALHDAEDGAGGHALPAARLPHDAERLPRADVEARPVHRLHRPLVLEEVGAEIAHLEDGPVAV